MTVTPEQINAERDMNPTFECSADGGPGNMFSWSKLPDGVVITESLELVINPRRACAARVTVLGSVCVFVCLSVC